MKRIWVFFSSVLILLFFVTVSSAESSDPILGKNNLFLRAGYSHFAEVNLRGRYAFCIGGTLFVAKDAGIELEGRINRVNNKYDSRQRLQSLGEGDLTLAGINVSILYMISLSKRFGLYVLAGAGYSFNNFSFDNRFSELGFHIEESIDNSLSLHVGTGLDIAILRKIALNLDVRYVISNTGGKWAVEDTLGTAMLSGETETNLNRLTFMLGLKFHI